MKIKISQRDVRSLIDYLEPEDGRMSLRDAAVRQQIRDKLRKSLHMSEVHAGSNKDKKRVVEDMEGQKRLEECV